jgi:polar amino acid transport system substrate-binding protein
MRTYTFFLFALFLFIGLNQSTQAQDIVNQILERGEIRVGMSGDQPPFSMTATDGSLFGLDVDMAKGLAENIGVKAKLVKMNFKDLIPALQNGEIDMIISGLTMSIDRNKKVAFIGPYLISGNTILTKSEKFKDIESISEVDKPGLKIVVMQGTTSEEFAKANVSKAILFKSATTKLAIQMLKDDQVDLMIGAYPTIALANLENPNENFYMSDEPFDYEPIGIAVAPSDPLLINLVGNYMNALEWSGILDMLKTKWFEEGSWISGSPIETED